MASGSTVEKDRIRLKAEIRRMKKLFSRENGLALGLCVLVILLIIVTSNSAPQWIYQGF